MDLHISYHTFGLIDGEDWPNEEPKDSNGLVAAYTAGAAVFTGIHSGKISVVVSALDTAPAQADLSRQWEEIVELSVAASSGHLVVRSFDHEPRLPLLSTSGPGRYRARVHAQGRDTDIDGTASRPVEFYLIQVWPAAFAEETIHRQTDYYGATRRSAADAALNRSKEPDGVTFEEWVDEDDLG
ncbi:hypothetical protein [Actinoplanes sp. CA-252034]|uniref:hypothetical protein n=1 Tax=Actinoplanes sp. CA-252034 TaxID=3239906 RepID=UPI003D951397